MKIKGIALSGIVLLAFILLLSSSHISRKLISSQITYNGAISSSSSLYKSDNGNLILLLKEKGEFADGMIYIISTQRREVYLPNRSNYTALPGLMFVWHTDQGGVLLGTEKSEVKPNVIADERNFSFTTAMTKARVELHW